PHGKNNKTPPAHASNGCSQPKKPAPKWHKVLRLRRGSPGEAGYQWSFVSLKTGTPSRSRSAPCNTSFSACVKPPARKTMLKPWFIELLGHFAGLSDAQLRQIEKSVPASKALIDLLIRAQPIIEQAQKLYGEAEPLIDEAMKEWQTIGPAAQILIDVIGHHVNKGSSPAEAAEA